MQYLRSNNAIALIFGQQQVHYQELFRRSADYAGALGESSCEKVALFAENRLEWAYALYGAWRRGCTAIPLDAMASPEEVAYMLEDSRPEVLFSSQEKRHVLEQALPGLSYRPRVLIFEELEETLRREEGTEKSKHAEKNTADVEEISLKGDDQKTALIIYTSGTTGNPKGAMLSFENLRVNAEAVSSEVPIYSRGCRALALLPLHHVLPLMGTLIIPLYVGGTVVFSPSMASEDILKTLGSHHVTILLGVPRLYTLFYEGIWKALQKSPAGKMLFALCGKLNSPSLSRRIFKKVHQRFGGHVRFMICGGAALEDHVARAFKILGFDMLLGYGMTEAAPMISFTRPGTMKIGSSGEVTPGSEVRIVEGEILARGKNIMQGYYKRPEETAEVLQEGWLHTGDLGYLDEEGFLFLMGRKKHTLVLSNGKNINPEEIEKVLLQRFDTLQEAAVCLYQGSLHALIYPNFARLHERGIHAVESFIRSDVIEPYNQKASPYKRILAFTTLREELPKTRLQKIKRFQLEELIENSGTPREGTPEPEYEEYQRIRDFLASQTPKPIFPQAHLEIDLHLDSLDKVSLGAYIENTFGIPLGDRELLSHPTLEQMAAYVREKKVMIQDEILHWGDILRKEIPLELPRSSLLHPPLVWTIKAFSRAFFRLHVRGMEYLAGGPYLLVANHQSYLDGLILASFFKGEPLRKLYFYATERHFRKGWQKRFAGGNNIILVDINRDLKLSLQKMAQVLAEGNSLVIFPEGSRTRDGRMGEFKKTFAILSRELNVPILPASIRGAFEAMPRGQKIPRFGEAIHIDFLPPLFPEGRSYEELTALVRQRIAENLSG